MLCNLGNTFSRKSFLEWVNELRMRMGMRVRITQYENNNGKNGLCVFCAVKNLLSCIPDCFKFIDYFFVAQANVNFSIPKHWEGRDFNVRIDLYLSVFLNIDCLTPLHANLKKVFYYIVIFKGMRNWPRLLSPSRFTVIPVLRFISSSITLCLDYVSIWHPGRISYISRGTFFILFF